MKKIASLLTAGVLAFSLSATTYASHIVLTDLEKSYAKDQIQALADNHFIQGYPDKSFKPFNKITRAEFAVMLANALELKLDRSASSKFTDVPDWAKPHVGALVNAGITEGIGEGKYGSDLNLSRQDLAVFFVRAMEMEEMINSLNIESTFDDANQISPYAQKSVAFLQQIGFILGDGKSYMPQSDSERQAVGKLIYNFTITPDLYFDKIMEVMFLAEFGIKEAVESVEFDWENGYAKVTLKTGEVIEINIYEPPTEFEDVEDVVEEEVPVDTTIEFENGVYLDGRTLYFDWDATNFVLDVDNYGGTHIEGHGHAHLYIKAEGEEGLGKKYGVKTKNFSLELDPTEYPDGNYVVSVSLETNDHQHIGEMVEYEVVVEESESTPASTFDLNGFDWTQFDELEQKKLVEMAVEELSDIITFKADVDYDTTYTLVSEYYAENVDGDALYMPISDMVIIALDEQGAINF